MILIPKEQVLRIHTSLIKETGGIDGVRDENLLDSALNSPFQTFDTKELYPEISDKAAQLSYSIIKNHPFLDGNKRIGVHIMLVFLALNNVKISYTQKELIDFGLKVADSSLSKDEIKNWLEKRTVFLDNKMAWNSKSGELNFSSLSDDEYWSLFNFVFSESCHKTSTYKFALLKSILDNLLNNTPSENGQLISYSDLFAKFAESFWNLVVKYHLHQQKPTAEGKTSKIEQIFGEAIKINPVLENLEFASIEENTRTQLTQKVQAECKKYVLGALYGDLDGKLYGFDQDGNSITVSQSAYEFLLKYKTELEKLNYYAWAKFLEKINEENVLFHLLSKLELSLPERTPLEIYRNILFSEFEECNCFYCGKNFQEKSTLTILFRGVL